MALPADWVGIAAAGAPVRAGLYVLASVTTCLAAALAGIMLTRTL